MIGLEFLRGNAVIITFIAAFLVFMLMGLPVAVSLGSTALVSGLVMWGFGGLRLDTMAQRTISGVNNFTTLAIPLFLLAGKMMNGGKITDRIFTFCQAVVGRFPGGLGYVNVLASVIFAGMSGSAAADAAGLGAIEIEAMTKEGYDKDFACAVTGASALISPIIPPSVVMVTFGVLSGTSVTKLFIGGVVPGLLMGLTQCGLVWYYSVKRGYPRSEKMNWRQAVGALWRALLPLSTPAIIIGGIWTGAFTPTEAAGVTVVYAFCLSMFVYRSMTWAECWRLLKDSLTDCAAIMVIMGCISAYGYVLTMTNIPKHLAGAILTLTDNPTVILLLINLFLLLCGCFMSAMECILLFTPIFLPLLQGARIDLVFFGVVMCVNLMIGQLTPPFGTTLFILSKIADIPLNRLVVAFLPFVGSVVAVIGLCFVFPGLVTWLPSLTVK
ncbi:MAG: TRAP transporter large permease [Planctomycetes bacterium]|nr:TRAP transporter large permease [Planctomycetota bacterium]